MIRILHTADWHLGQNFFSYDRKEEHQHFLDWLKEEISAHGVDVLLIAGDVFDVSNPSASAQKMYYKFIHSVTSSFPDLQIVLIAGNHDSASRLEAPSPLLEELNTIVKGKVRKVNGEIDYADLMIALKSKSGETEAYCLAVPFLRQGDYPVIEGAQNSYAEGVREFYKQLIDYATARAGDKPLVVMGHLQATGSEIAEKEHSERTIIGGLECITPDVFTDAVAYVALGHLHKSQRVSGRENVRYAGSPLSFSFAEKHYKHGVVLVTLSDGKEAEIDKLEYTPLVPLVSIPAQGAASPIDILSELEFIPDATKSELTPDQYPYLEIKVRFTEPDPMFTRRVMDLLSNKPYRLARVNQVYAAQTDESTFDDEAEDDLQSVEPLQVMRNVFAKKYADLPGEEFEKLFNEVCFDVNNKEE